MIGSLFAQLIAVEKLFQRYPSGALPGNAPLGLESFEVTDKERPEINTGKNGRTSTPGKVWWGAVLFKPGIETMGLITLRKNENF
jgi:hypothetical protein